MHPHVYHFGEITWSTSNHAFIIKRTESIQKDLGHLFLFQRWINLSSSFSPSLGIFFESFMVFLSHGSKLVSVWSHIRVILVLSDKGLTAAIESSNISAIPACVPLQCGTSQTVLKVMDKQLMIICIGRHLSGIHHKMTLGTRTTFVLLKVRDFKFSRYLYTGNQT